MFIAPVYLTDLFTLLNIRRRAYLRNFQIQGVKPSGVKRIWTYDEHHEAKTTQDLGVSE
jgi:hypothetical protein